MRRGAPRRMKIASLYAILLPATGCTEAGVSLVQEARLGI